MTELRDIAVERIAELEAHLQAQATIRRRLDPKRIRKLLGDTEEPEAERLRAALMIHGLFGHEALARLLAYPDVCRILDIGCGRGEAAALMRAQGRSVTTIAKTGSADFLGDYMDYEAGEPFDAIWASHVLEHLPNVNLFLRKCFSDLHSNGVLAITVPPYKPELVGGHLTLWTPALLLYNLIIAGFDCSEARVSPCYANAPEQQPYNLSVIVRKKPAHLPDLACDAGDIERLASFFPCPVWQNMDGRLEPIRW